MPTDVIQTPQVQNAFLALERAANAYLSATAPGAATPGAPAGANPLLLLKNFTSSLRESTRGLDNFVRALLPIPSSLGQLARQSLAAGAPTALSTLQKSFDLVLGEIARVFIPAIALASVALQQFALWLKSFNAKDFQDWIDRTFGKPAEMRAAKGGAPEPIEELRARRGVEPLAGLRPATEAEIAARPKPSTLFDSVSMAMTAATILTASRRATGGLPGGAGGGGTRTMVDNPPGYQARISSYDQLREQMLLAVTKSPLDMAKERQAMERHKEMIDAIKAVERAFGIKPDLPER